MAIIMREEAEPADAPSLSDRRAWGVVVVFMLIYLVSYIDRQTLTVVVDPVKASLGLNDTQIGLLQGFIFTTVMVFAAIPMAYFIDRYNRINILVACIVIWSCATIYSGFATNFVELTIGRIGVAIAEAVVPIAAMSVIGDLFPRNKVGGAASVFMNGSYFGNGLALLIGGSLLTMMIPYNGAVVPLMGRFEAWRGLFIAVGLLSLVVAIGVRLFLREPKRREIAVARDNPESFISFVRSQSRFIIIYCLFCGFLVVNGYSLYAWSATLLIRVHEMTPQNVGLIIGPMFLITSVPGTVVAAWLAGRCHPGKALQHLLKVMISLTALLVPMVIGMCLAPTGAALGFTALTLLAYAACHAGMLVPIQLVTPNRMRARIAAITTALYVIPAGLGPVAIGYLTDQVFGDPMALGKSMAIVMGGSATLAVLSGLAAWRIAVGLEQDQAACSTRTAMA